MITVEQILAALKKLGPVRPGELADHLHVEQSSLMYHVKKLLDAGTIKASGVSNARRLALPEQKIEDTLTPPQPGRKASKKKRRGKRNAAKPRAATTPPAPVVPFVAALTADARLVVIDGEERPRIYSTGQAEEIATVLANRFE